MEANWDCIVVGGGAAGLSAALVLGRARRRTLLVDAGQPSNLTAEGIGGLLGHNGRPPAELYAMGRAELGAYPTVEVRDGKVEGGERVDGGFALELARGARELTRRVILATGMEYRRPDLPGLAPLWGRSVFHCPFCHGWEMRDAALAVLGGGRGGLQRTLLLRGWSDDVMLLSDGPAELDADDLERLAAAGVEVDERPVARLIARDDALAAVEFADGSSLPREGLLVPVTVAQRSSVAAQLGAEPAEPGPWPRTRW
jgi:thioredoxin reductase